MKGRKKSIGGGTSSSETGVQTELAPPYADGMAVESVDAPPPEEVEAVEKGEDDQENQEIQENEEIQEAEGDVEEELRPKLAEGFYEIEAVRRKRVRKV